MTKYFLTLAALMFVAAPSYISSAHAEDSMIEAVSATAKEANATEAQSGEEAPAYNTANEGEAANATETQSGEEAPTADALDGEAAADDAMHEGEEHHEEAPAEAEAH